MLNVLNVSKQTYDNFSQFLYDSRSKNFVAIFITAFSPWIDAATNLLEAALRFPFVTFYILYGILF